MRWKINPFFGTHEHWAITIMTNHHIMSDGTKWGKEIERKPSNLVWKVMLYLFERWGSEGWSPQKGYFDVSSIYSSLYDSKSYEYDVETKILRRIYNALTKKRKKKNRKINLWRKKTTNRFWNR